MNIRVDSFKINDENATLVRENTRQVQEEHSAAALSDFKGSLLSMTADCGGA